MDSRNLKKSPLFSIGSRLSRGLRAAWMQHDILPEAHTRSRNTMALSLDGMCRYLRDASEVQRAKRQFPLTPETKADANWSASRSQSRARDSRPACAIPLLPAGANCQRDRSRYPK